MSKIPLDSSRLRLALELYSRTIRSNELYFLGDLTVLDESLDIALDSLGVPKDTTIELKEQGFNRDEYYTILYDSAMKLVNKERDNTGQRFDPYKIYDKTRTKILSKRNLNVITK